MNYDTQSFLAGIAVGRALKGWASVPRGDRCPRAEPESVYALAAARASGRLSWTVTAAEEDP